MTIQSLVPAFEKQIHRIIVKLVSMLKNKTAHSKNLVLDFLYLYSKQNRLFPSFFMLFVVFSLPLIDDVLSFLLMMTEEAIV